MATAIPHLTSDELELYSLRHADSRLVGRIEEHLPVCEKCRCSLSRMEEQLALMRQLFVQFANDSAASAEVYRKKAKAATAH